MTITRLWQANAELQDVLSEFTTRSSSNFTTSGTEAKTGSQAFRTINSNYASLVLDAATAQMRMGLFINHNGTNVADEPSIVRFRDGSTTVVDLRWDGDNSTFQLFVGSTEQDSAISATFANTSTWYHIGIDMKIHASTGWVHVYLDGVEVVSYTGNTTGGSTEIDTIEVGSPRTSNNWNSYVYYDDLYIDDTVGEATTAVVPDLRFLSVTPNGNGNSSDWDGSDGNSTDNYLLVDETPPDDDTTYVETDTSGLNDDYTLSDITLPTGYSVAATIVFAIAKKLNAAGTTDLKLETRTTVSATEYFVSSSAFTLGTDYALFWDRRTVRPDSGAWDETTVNALEMGVISD